MDVQIIMPPVTDECDPLEFGLIALTQAVAMLNPDAVAHGALGGEYGYGARWSNSTFVMRPYYWGDCDCGYSDREHEWSESNNHDADCYQTVSAKEIAGLGLRGRLDEALERRNKLKWGSAMERDAQRAVESAYDAIHVQEEIIRKRLCEQHGIPWNSGNGCAVHCTCDYKQRWSTFSEQNPGHLPACSLQQPNFRHHASGLEVRWYKWIGRDTYAENPNNADIAAVFKECVASLTAA